MRTRTILVALLAAYAIVSTGYFVLHTFGNGGRTPSLNSEVGAPVATPFPEAGAAADSRQDLMARTQIASALQYTNFQSFVCSERMDRYKGHLDGGHSSQIDTVSAQVSFENGVENYTGIQQNNRQRATLSSLPGAWSEGEFGTLLRQSSSLLASHPLASKTTSEINGEAAVIYAMEVSGQESPWSLYVGNQSYRMPFKTEVSVSQSSGRILEIVRTSEAVPPGSGISQIQWSVVLKPTPIDGKTWILPATGSYSVLYQQENRREWNVINFSDYHRYAASSVVHF